jgi:SPP1 family predicted phage head-tail adaptor
MGIGQRRQIQLSQVLVTIDANGRNIESAGQVFNTWAEVTEPSGFRDYSNGQTQLGKTKRFLIRFRFDKYPNCEWKIKYAGVDWTISEIRKIDEKQFYWLLTGSSKSDV